MSRVRLLAAYRRLLLVATILLVLVVIAAQLARAQDADPRPERRDTLAFPNTIAGEFTPGTGFDIIRTTMGSLNVSFYGLFRYVNQTPGAQTFVDHLGRERPVNARNDVNWHRTMIWLTGFFYDPRFRYNITVWSLPTTQQSLIFGNLQYRAAPWFSIGVGIAPSLTARSIQGSWPFWASSERQLAEEFFRGGFSSGAFVTGELGRTLAYTATVNNNISQLGVTQANDTRDMTFGVALRWRPTTGEFGPRGGFGDLEHHERLATQLGASATHSRESRYAPLGQPPNATQIKLSDGVNPFEDGALAPGVTVEKLTYRELAFDAGAKYRGFSFQSEYYVRTLDDFLATGPLPLTSIRDHGFMAEAMHMVLPKRLGVYAVGSYVFDDFRRFPWEAGGGADYYPSGTRSWRVNLHLLHVNRSPVASFFSYYQPGFTGTLMSIGVDVLL